MFKLLIKTVVMNLLTVYYALKCLVFMGFYAITHPFSNPWTTKLRLMPPEIVKHPKYGVHKYIKVNNVKIHYAESGDPSKPLMIFIHGYPEFWYSWRHQIVEFNKNYWCIAVDMRGYGDSEKPESLSAYLISNMVEDIRDLVRQLGREKCILIGHDWGGVIGWEFRETYPDAVMAYISLASSSAWVMNKLLDEDREQFSKSWYMLFYRAWWVPELIMRFKDMAVFDTMMRCGDNSNITDDDVEAYKYTFGKPDAFTPPINYYRANITSATIPGVKPPKELSAPGLFIQAGKDDFLVKRQAETFRNEYVNCEAVVLEDCAHFCQQENPEVVNAAIKEFLNKHNL